jgi:hypothetical protein
MSFNLLPKELRLQIWAAAYFTQPPRFVSLRTRPHDETHDEATFCPRYSPTPSPTISYVCRESRAEAQYQAQKAGHVVQLPSPLAPPPREFIFRFGVDVLLVDFTQEAHFDDSPESGFLVHFRQAHGCDPTALTAVAITKVHTTKTDGSICNCIRDFPRLSRLVFVASPPDLASVAAKADFVRTAANVAGMYEFDMLVHYPDRHWALSKDSVGLETVLDVDFAVQKAGEIILLPAEEWHSWATPVPDFGPTFSPEDLHAFSDYVQ